MSNPPPPPGPHAHYPAYPFPPPPPGSSHGAGPSPHPYPYPFPPPGFPGFPFPYAMPPPPRPPVEPPAASSSSAPATTVLPTRSVRKPTNFKGTFSKDLKQMMFGFGDEFNCAPDTVGVMEEILIEYILEVCNSASQGGRKTRLTVEDLRRVLSLPADSKKLARMEELLFMQEDIKRARAEFEDDEAMTRAINASQQ